MQPQWSALRHRQAPPTSFPARGVHLADISPSADLHGFFVEHVTGAMRDLGVETAAETQGYLVDLLSDFAVSQRLQVLGEPLVTLLQRAQQATGPERYSRMRELGDVALFICGFFPDSFDRRGVSRGYVVSMGGRAYLVLGKAEVQATRDQPRRAEVFVELGGRFQDMARVLDEVRERTAMCTEGEVVRLYERWSRSGSPALAHRLQRRGVHPQRSRPPGRLN
jgi:hypothetical protein